MIEITNKIKTKDCCGTESDARKPAHSKAALPTTAHSKAAHPSHRHLLNRLKRSEGQFRGILNMIESDRYCIDILVQTRALIASLRAAETEIMNVHVNHCVQDAIKAEDPEQAKIKLQELVGLFQKMDA